MDISLEERQAFTEAVYDELITSILLILERLDLTSNKTDEGETDAEQPSTSTGDGSNQVDDVSSDPVSGLQAAKPKDFIIFINMVDFARFVANNRTSLRIPVNTLQKYPHCS